MVDCVMSMKHVKNEVESMSSKQSEHICVMKEDEHRHLQQMIEDLPLQTLQNWFKGLADATRIKIGYVLMAQGEMCVHDVADV